MINRAHRFHRRNAIRAVYRNGHSVRANQIALKIMRNNRSESYRAAVVVSRKVHKSAVLRNRIRRRIYEALRTFEPQILQPYDLIFIVYSDEFATIDYARLHETIGSLLKSGGAVKDS